MHIPMDLRDLIRITGIRFFAGGILLNIALALIKRGLSIQERGKALVVQHLGDLVDPDPARLELLGQPLDND
ncbi:hypothetical protein AMK22_34095 [Streptomyces sp. CB01580]|nr:hypothetical protein AMK22_34095 [Streptomyces sp. CB01580]